MNTRRFVFLGIILLIVTSCKREINYSDVRYEDTERYDFDPYLMDITTDDDVEIFLDATGDYPDGTYCAEVEYYNPNTGTLSLYTLNVDVEDGDMTVIHWPNGGWLDDTHFYPENISSGEVEFTSDRGYIYTVTLDSYGGCSYTDEYKLMSDVNADVEATTCPNCGDEKDEYDELCYSCERKKVAKEHTCQLCGGYKNYSYDDYCDYCQESFETNGY